MKSRNIIKHKLTIADSAATVTLALVEFSAVKCD